MILSEPAATNVQCSDHGAGSIHGLRRPSKVMTRAGRPRLVLLPEERMPHADRGLREGGTHAAPAGIR